MHRKKRVFVAALLVACLVLLGAAISPLAQGKEKDEPNGKIISPKAGTTVSRDETFKVQVRATNIPKDHQLYAVVEVANLLWPKEQPLEQFKKGGEWTTTISEGGDPGPEFRLTVLLVPPAGVKVLDKWFEKGKASGEWPGLRFRDVPGADRLDSVKLKLLR
jgi:hypothetical protein